MLTGAAASLYDRKPTSGIVVSPDIISALEAALSAKVDVAPWLLFTYAADSGKDVSVVLRAVGDGGFEELCGFLAPDQVSFAVASFLDDTKRKFCFLTHVGSSISGMKRARVALHKAGIYKAFDGSVCADIMLDDPINGADVLSKLKGSCSSSSVVSFKPTPA